MRLAGAASEIVFPRSSETVNGCANDAAAIRPHAKANDLETEE
jgi:hypothetical protein